MLLVYVRNVKGHYGTKVAVLVATLVDIAGVNMNDNKYDVPLELAKRLAKYCNIPYTITNFLTEEKVMADRPSWDQYFINIAREVAMRATCERASVGAVVVIDNHILSTGYNGAPHGEAHCIDEGCLMENGHCERTIHAETNAIVQAAKYGVNLNGATLYFWSSYNRTYDHKYGDSVTGCNKCLQVMKMAGIKRMVDKNLREVRLNAQQK